MRLYNDEAFAYTQCMQGSWLDHIPSHERMRLRKRLRSTEAYEKLRERVKGPQDLGRELKRGEAIAELHFGLETEPEFHDALKKQVEKDVREKGIDVLLDDASASPDVRKAIEQGKFVLTVSAHPKTHHDMLTVVPEGTVQEKLPLKQSFNDRYLAQFLTM